MLKIKYKDIQKYVKKYDVAPYVGIIFNGKEATVSFRPKDKMPVFHIHVVYGITFWFRLILVIRKVFILGLFNKDFAVPDDTIEID